MTTNPTTLDPIRQDLQRWQDTPQSDTIEADTYRVLAGLIDEAVKLLREMESVLSRSRQERD